MAAQTLARWRWEGGKIPFSRIGRVVVYDIADLDTYAAEHRRGSTSDLGAADHSDALRKRPAYASDAALLALEKRIAELTQRVEAVERFLERVRFSAAR